MGKKSAPPPPDYTPIAMAAQSQQAASADQLAFSREALSAQQGQAAKDYQQQQDALDWAKGAYADQSNTNKAIIGYDMQQQDQQSAIQKASADNAAKAQARYESVYQPLEDQAVKDAQDYASPERRSQAMGTAAAGVAEQSEAARVAAAHNLESFGIDPSSTRYAAMDAGIRQQGAAAAAGAANQAGLQTDATGRQLVANAINVGRGLPSDINAGNSTAINAGNAGVGAGSAAGNLGLTSLNTGSNIFGSPTQYGALGNSAYGTGVGALNAGTGAINAGTGALSAWGNTMNQGYQNQLSAFNANQNASSGFGSALGIAAGFIPGLAEGGPAPDSGQAVPTSLSPSGGKAIDDVPARLTPGEYVVPKDVVQWKGEEFFQNLNDKSRKDRMERTPRPNAIPVPAHAFTRPGAIPAQVGR